MEGRAIRGIRRLSAKNCGQPRIPSVAVRGTRPLWIWKARLSLSPFNSQGLAPQEAHRSLWVDAMIAGTATVAGARLATNSRSDFDAFVPHGLQLI